MIPYIRYKIEPCDTGKYSLAWPLAVYETAALPLSYAGMETGAEGFKPPFLALKTCINILTICPTILTMNVTIDNQL